MGVRTSDLWLTGWCCRGPTCRSQNRQPIQTLEDARDAVQAIYIGKTYIVTGSVDGHVRTYDLRMGELRTDFFGRTCILLDPSVPTLTTNIFPPFFAPEPVTSIVPSQDNQTYLATTLDAHIRLMDMSTGKMLNDFQGHASTSYRIRSCFGHGEATVLCGDEHGTVWAWDLVDVRIVPPFIPARLLLTGVQLIQATPLQPNPPPKVHERVITWIEQHPVEAGELITASADGMVKVWRTPS